MPSYSSEEVKLRYQKDMGHELGSLFNELWQSCAGMHMLWEEFVQLYGSKPRRFEIMNEASPYFFRMLQDTLWEAVLLHICRITDPPKSVGKSNLTIRQFSAMVKPEVARKLLPLLAECEVKCNFARSWRNRRISHSDLALALNQNAEPLTLASRLDVKEALRSIAVAMNCVEKGYADCTTCCDRPAMHGGALDLMYIMSDGLKARAKRTERLHAGEATADDFAIDEGI